MKRPDTAVRAAKLLLVLAGMLSPHAAFATQEYTSLGRRAVHAYASHSGTLNVAAPFVSATLPRARAGSVLEIHVVMEKTQDADDHDVGMRVAVNGHPTTSRDTFATQCAEEVLGPRCAVAGVFFLDVDLAEQQSPGEFVGRDLDIDVFFAPKNPGPPASTIVGLQATLAARTRRR